MTQVYHEFTDLSQLLDEVVFLAKLKKEHGAVDADAVLEELHSTLERYREKFLSLPQDRVLANNEPSDLEGIRAARPDGPRHLPFAWNEDAYRDKLEGALLSRMAGCTLGAIVEGWPVADMEAWAAEIGDTFPPTDYWSVAKTPSLVRYMTNRCDEFTRDQMDGVPADDDIIYTLLGVMLMEQKGFDFSVEDIGKMWDEYLPWIWKDMQWPLNRMLCGTPATEAAEGNPYSHCICPSIRIDPYGYAMPGSPEMAASLAYRDAYMSHRRNGIYGAMFFAAAIAAAFAVTDPVEALRIGLTEIPRQSQFADAINWALSVGENLEDFRDARQAVDDHFGEMADNRFHIIPNACLTVFGVMIGGTDITRVISQTVAMGMDNDCTAATAASIVGAIVGKTGVPNHWYRNFNDRIHSYIRGHREFSIADLVDRYTKLASSAVNSQ